MPGRSLLRIFPRRGLILLAGDSVIDFTYAGYFIVTVRGQSASCLIDHDLDFPTSLHRSVTRIAKLS